jgi:hypothetical protein
MPLFLFNTQTVHIKSVVSTSFTMISLKTFYLIAGLEPGSSNPQADAMSTAPGSLDNYCNFLGAAVVQRKSDGMR